jgi:hypothetical protein
MVRLGQWEEEVLNLIAQVPRAGPIAPFTMAWIELVILHRDSDRLEGMATLDEELPLSAQSPLRTCGDDLAIFW